jgi:hypothetical protein
MTLYSNDSYRGGGIVRAYRDFEGFRVFRDFATCPNHLGGSLVELTADEAEEYGAALESEGWTEVTEGP